MPFLSAISDRLHRRDRGVDFQTPSSDELPASAELASIIGANHDISESALDAISRNNEVVRDRFLSIFRKFNDVMSLRDDFGRAVDEVGAILEQTEGANSTLLERSVMLALEEQAHRSLQARYRALNDENESNSRKARLLSAEVERHGELVKNREKRIEALERELSALQSSVQSLQSERDSLHAALSDVNANLACTTAEIAKGDSAIGELQIEKVALTGRLSAIEHQLDLTQSHLLESQDEAEALRTDLADAERKVAEYVIALREADADRENFELRLAGADARVVAANDKYLEIHASMQQATESHAREIVRLRGEIDDANSRAGSLAEINASLNLEAQAASLELRKAQRRMDQLEAKISPLEDRAQDAEFKAAELKSVNAKLAASSLRVTNRARALLRGMRDLKEKLAGSERRAAMLEERAAIDAAKFDEVEERLRETIRQLAEQVEKEKLARCVTSGALEAARRLAVRSAEDETLFEILKGAETSGSGGYPRSKGEAAQTSGELEAPPTSPEAPETRDETMPVSRKTRRLGSSRARSIPILPLHSRKNG